RAVHKKGIYKPCFRVEKRRSVDSCRSGEIELPSQRSEDRPLEEDAHVGECYRVGSTHVSRGLRRGQLVDERIHQDAQCRRKGPRPELEGEPVRPVSKTELIELEM